MKKNKKGVMNDVKKLRKLVKEDCPSPIVPLVTLLLIAIIIVGFAVFALVKQNVAPQYYIDANGVERQVKLIRINDRLVYDSVTKAVYWNDKAHGDDGHMTSYLGEHLRPCKYINGRVVEQKD